MASSFTQGGLDWIFFMDRVVKPWQRLHKAVVKSPSLVEFKSHVDVASGTCLVVVLAVLMEWLDSVILGDFSILSDSVIIFQNPA